MITIGADICANFESSTSKEWLETNGIGGYASSTIAGLNTRRYHGLLVAATKPPLGREVLLSKFEETLISGEKRFHLSSNQYPGEVHPRGYEYLKEFRLDPFPVWTYEIEGIVLEKRLFMIYGENSTVIEWNAGTKGDRWCPLKLEIRPLIAFRDHHHLIREDSDRFRSGYVETDQIIWIVGPDNGPGLSFAHNGGDAMPTGHWYRHLEYAIEEERGFDYREDLYQPFALSFDLAESVCTVVSDCGRSADDIDRLSSSEIERRRDLLAGQPEDDTSRQLLIAADQFVVSRGEGRTVLAGYHWFSDWGRDTMIALAGLTLETGRSAIAKSILLEFSKYISEGMLPNRFPDVGEMPDYNTVDATLWFFEAIRAYSQAADDDDFVLETLYPVLCAITDWHVRGTRFGIHVDTDGLLSSGEEGTQLTWMDAKVGEWVVTPRSGKPVEIEALWYNALCIMADLAERVADPERVQAFRSMADAAKASFNGQFWNDDEDCLFDVVRSGEKDPAVRPNQIFAVSLPHTMLDLDRARKVVEKVESELLTPYGLRSLSPKDPSYVGVYIGNSTQRDGSYHQGTVWSWLIGPFIDAYRRVHAEDPKLDDRVTEMLSKLHLHLQEAMLGQVSEIFDGDFPHAPRGCAAQAWSVAELIRVGRST